MKSREMNIAEFLDYLKGQQLHLYVEDGRLLYRAADKAPSQEVLEQIRSRRSELIDYLGGRSRAQATTESKEAYPLSQGQEALWFLYEMDRSSLAYNTFYSGRLARHVNPEALRDALRALEARHPVLRTRFGTSDGRPYQSTTGEALEPGVTDVSGWSREEVEHYIAELADKPFDLEAGPVARLHLLTSDDDDDLPTPLLVLVVHHIVIDFRSLEILFRDLTQLYYERLGQERPELPPLLWSYRDYVGWTRTWPQTEDGRRARSYWLRQLSGELPVLDLPTDFPRPPHQQYEGGTLISTLSPDITARLRAFAREHLVTPNVVLLTAFGMLLHRYSRQQQLLIGSPMLGRNRAELNDMVGYFVNSVVLRLRFDEASDGLALLSQVRATVLDALAHQDYPFPLLVEELRQPRDQSRSPLFQVAFVYERESGTPLETLGLFDETLLAGQRGAVFDLTLTALERGDTIRLTWEYAAALFEPATIERMLGHYQQQLLALLEQPEQQVSTFPLLTEAEKHQLRAWNETRAPYPSDQTLVDLFAAQVSSTPDAVALEADTGGLSYRELDARSNRLARRLQALGVGRNTCVGILLPRSAEMIIAVLGVLKAGGAYLPLDPEHPAERLGHVFRESGAQVLLTQEWLDARLPASGATSLYLEPDGSLLREGDDSPFACPATPDDLVYVIYTSGSTGQPKGVAMSHRSLVNLVVWQGREPGLDCPARVLQYTPLSFDVSFQEIATTLNGGGTLVLIDDERRRDSDALLKWLRERRIERLFLPFVALQHLAESAVAAGGLPPTLRDVITAGEQLRITPAIRRCFEQSRCRLHNHYGPTETHAASAFRLPEDVGQWQTLPPIGRPIANLQVHLLDSALQPVPVGLSGEVYIGGAGLAQGYLNRPELTAERFIMHDGLGRLYRTGDLARWRADGNLEYLGRCDNQIKLRGFRIELGEIEAVLGRHPSVNETAVVVNGAGESRHLAAYVGAGSLIQEEATLRRSLEAHMRRHLPNYMMPATVTVLERLPQTPSGKVDRQSLSSPDVVRGNGNGHGYIAPRDETESLLASLWASLLGLSRVSVTDNFFELGGHSLLASRLVARIRDSFGVEISLRALFEQPTVAALAALIESYKGALELPPLKALPGDVVPPLSFGQQRLWFLEQLAGPSATYNMPAALELCGRLDEAALRRALQALVVRHTSLRLCFPAVDGQPRLRVLAAYDPLNYTDLSVRAAAEREAEAERLYRRHAAQPFDVAHGPLLRLHLLRLDEETHWLLFNMHHIISDGWSLGVMMREVAALYTAEVESSEAMLPPLTVQYPDYAAWQRGWLQGETLEGQLSYWRQQLAGAPPLLELPSDRPRPARRSYRGGLLAQTLDAELAAEVRRFNLAHGSTLFMTMLGVLDVLLWRYSGQNDLLVGSPLGNRRDSQTENLIGFFVNTLVLRSRVSAESGFDSLVAEIRQTCLDAFAHQDLPFEKLVDELQPERSFSYSPLFQVMLALQNAPLEDLRLPGLTVERLPPPLTQSKFDLTLYVEEQSGELRLHWEYSTDLFDPERIGRMAGHFEQILRGALARPARPIAELRLLTNTESGQLLDWQVGPQYELEWENVVEAIEQQAQRTPAAKAVVSGHRSLTYAELNRRANQLAHYLQLRGIGRGDRVALCLPREIEMPVAVLGVLKAGAAYLPLDPNYPAARINFIVSDAGASLLLSHSSLRPRLTEATSEVCWLDEEATAIAAQPSEDFPMQAGPDDHVYVIYTSGSTGQPKGAAVFHRGFANLLHWYCRTLDLTSDDRVLLISALGFDLTQKNLFAPLLVGGSLHLPASDTYDPEAIAAAIEAQQITWFNCTPSTIYPVVEAEDSERFKSLTSLRWVVLGGEPIQMSRLRSWLDSPHCSARVLNSYGPTECTDVCVAWPFDRQSKEDPVPLGHPVDNVVLAVLDDRLQPVPEGLPGELWIGGIGLGAGYLNRPELNAERFVEVEVFGQRQQMYRSGDVVRWRSDGVLEYLGRADTQIKLRGFRIELGEIESALLELPGIREAVVIVHGSDSQQKLVAYVVADRARATDKLHIELEQRLPEYMIPGQFVHLDSLPLTPNGKLDREALPDPEEAPGKVGGGAPATPTEVRLAEVWGSLLGLTQIDRYATFFDLGGHSLLATQVIVRIHDHFGIDLPLESLFEHPTVAGLAAIIEAEQSYRLPPLVPEPPEAEPVLSFAQTRLWFFEQLVSGTAYNIPAAIAVTGPLDETALHRALCHLVERHSSLRLRFPEQDGQPQARLLPVYDPLVLTDLSDHPNRDEEAERLRDEHITKRFSLSEGPLFSLHLVRLEPERHWLLFNMHHIISDGWSMDVLIREFAQLYTAYHRGKAASLPPLPIQYTDYAAWQRRCLQGSALEEQLGYWRNQLADAPERLVLPTDFPRPAILQHLGGELFFDLDASLVERLRGLGRKADSTLFMVLLAAYNILLCRYSGQKDISVGTPVANRNHSQLENVVGLFLNTLVMRTRVQTSCSFSELLDEVRRTTLAAYAHQDLPFEYLVEQLQPQRSLSYNPLFQVLLNLVNTRSEEVRLDGMKVEHLNAPPGLLSKFDLSLSLTERADGGLDGRLEYNAELFIEETIRFLTERFVILLQQIAARPEAPINELSLLDARWGECVTALRQPRPKTAPVSFGSIEQSLPGRFAEQVGQYPSRIAVRTPETTLTYSELDKAARRVAAAILELPPAPRVALLLPHEASMIVGLIGTLQAGCAYVPLDSAHPFERLAYILDDTQISVIVCTAALRPLAERLAGTARHIVDIDNLTTEPACELPSVSPDSIAYVLYTSGSTGQPKGVIQSHDNVLHFIRQYTENLHITPEDRLLQVASYSFDASVMDIFGALLNGATLYLVNLRSIALEEVCEWLRREAVTIYHSTPTVYRLFVNALKHPLPEMRLVVLGGEAVVRSDAEAFRRHFGPDALFINGLGPTESTVTLQYFLDHEMPLRRSAVPVGYPVGDTEVLLLDEDGQPTELYGEIVIRSAHVALGYWRHESASFSDDPHQPGKRLYRTGDLARLLPDGSLEAAGRRDTQIKLRGFRIELGEIEAALRLHPSVREAAVTLWRDADAMEAEPRLVAYVSGEVEPAELKDYARQKLPDYMMPAAVMVLESLPLTVTGKLERRNLPPPDFHSEAGVPVRTAAPTSTQPSTETEIELANLWESVLGTKVEDADADFFDLGGHSLLVMQLLARIRDSFSVELPLFALFEHTVLREQAEQIEALSQPAGPPPVTPLPPDAPLPLSFAQQRLWFLSQFQTAESDTYTISAALRLDGALDVAALRAALFQLTERQQSLRMNFESRQGQPFITLRPAYDPLTVLSLRHLSGDEQGEAVRTLAEEHARRPFNLAAEPLLRLSLIELDDDSHLLLFNMHHIISDGWSLGVLVRELSTLYLAARDGSEPALAPLSIQYADYAAWQREWLQGEVLERQLSYWREQLQSAPSLLHLPTDFPRPAVQTYRGGRVMRQLDEGLAESLKQLSRGEEATLYMTLLAAFDVMLWRYSGQEEFVVGTPIANRTQSCTEELIGLFVNTLALRTKMQDGDTFRQLLAKVRETALGAYAHQDVPFEKLVEELQPERNLSHSPIFQVVFALQNITTHSLELGGLPLHVLDSERGMSKYDLFLAVSEQDGELFCSLEYNTDLFEPTTADRLLSHYETLLKGIASDAGRLISELPLLTEAERHQILTEWSGTRTDYPNDKCIHHLFEEQAARTPEALALISRTEQLTYAELNRRANQLAHRLRHLGVGPESLVAICSQRSPEMLVALLAIFKAGGAYLPLDPSYPSARLSFMLQTAQPSVLLTQQSLVERLPAHQARLLLLDADHETIARESEDSPQSAVTPDNLAYIIFTSGSTGQPKGVQLSHRGLANLATAQAATFKVRPEDRILQFASLSFDASIFEIVMALTAGASLYLESTETVLAGRTLSAALAEHEITNVTLPPSVLLSLPAETVLPRLRTLIVAGESCPAELVSEWADGREFYNAYGPTEATVWTTVALCLEGSERPPIGGPISNSEVYLLDERMEPVPVGVPGELYIGGVGLARGYVDRAELTAERFVPHPFSRRAGERLYRTGDICRWRADGNIEYLGRADQQVKVRGFRIELEEIEASLRQQEGVSECVVIAREEAAGDKRLVAYVVAAGGANLDVSRMRAAVRERLPEYMVPSVIVQLEALPLTPSGKVDRKALPAPEESGSGREGEYTAPRTPIEEVLTGIWAEVLRVKEPSVNDNFFELGGHSLLATQVISHVRSVFQVEVALRLLFERPTIAELAQSIEARLREGESAVAPPMLPRGSIENPPLSFAQQRLWFIHQLEPDNPSYNLPASLRLKGALDTKALERTFNEVIRRHEVLCASFLTVEGQPVQLIGADTELQLPCLDLRGLAEQEREAEVRRRARAEAHQPFDLSHGPLLRAQLLRLDEEEHVLLFTMHHIASDGWSMDIFIREVAALYEAFARGEASPLPPLSIQYGDYAAWQREWLQGEVLERQLSYWREQLQGAPSVLELPTDRPRPATRTFNGARQHFEIPTGLRDELVSFSRREGVTLFMTLLAAWQTLLSRHSGQQDILVGSPIANRNRTETEDLIGFFVNTLVLRTDLSGNPSFRQLLARVRETALGAYTHQDVPFEMLVEELQPERSLSHSPLFQVVFALQNARLGEVALSGLELRSLEQETGTAKFDLLLNMVERGPTLAATWEYSTDLFDDATISRMAGQFLVLLHGIVADPDQTLSRLPLLTDEERRQLLVEFNHTATAYPRESTVHRLFEEQAARTPEAVAVVCGNEQYTYAELNSRANRLAHYLRAQGAGTEQLVGVLMERRIEMVVALLATLKAGAAYLPLDPEYPDERLRFMLEDAGVRLLLTHGPLAEKLSVLPAQTIRLDQEWQQIAEQSEQNPEGDATAESLAYVIYTSGSTGRPKGVSIPHRGIVRLVTQTNYAHFSSDEVFLQLAPISFDAATFEVWGALLNGTRLILLPSRSPSLEELGQTLRHHQVTTLWLTAGLFHLMVEHNLEGLRGLRQLLAGGDVLSVSHVQKVLDELSDCRLINGYGPTENTTFTCCHTIEPRDLAGGSVPIGRPIGNTEVYVLDEQMEPVAVGVAGELYIGGDGLAREYLKRPELTAERFVPHPFSEVGGERLYRTGDVCRWRADGVVEFLGRRDNQVKVRGFRVELGEVEAMLRQEEEVSEAAVVVQGEGEGRRLLAFISEAVAGQSDVAALKRRLRQRLPEYMMPSQFVLLNEMPLNANGKIDRSRLPVVREAETVKVEGEAQSAPQTITEDLLAVLWCEVLKRESVGRDDDFFELGGHSLLATQLVSRIRKVFHSQLPLATVFSNSTLRDMAAQIDAGRGPKVFDSVITRVDRSRPLPLSFAQERLWFLSQLEPENPFYNTPLGLRLSGSLNREALRLALQDLLARHEVLRTAFRNEGGRPRQMVLDELDVPLSEDDLSGLSPVELEAALHARASIEARTPFRDLSVPPLFRAVLLKLGTNEHALLLTFHHIVIDGWSLSVLIRELAHFYNARCTGENVELPSLPIQYADFAAWQREWLQGETLERQLDYWRRQLAGAPPMLALPTDHPRPAVQQFRGSTIRFSLERSTRDRLHRLGRAHDATLFMTLLSSFAVLLYRYSGQTDIIIGSPIANRQHAGLEDLLGFFVNTMTLRVDLSGRPHFSELVNRVQQLSLDAYEHQDLPFEKLVDELQPERDLSRSPLFQVMFTLQNMPLEVSNISGLRLSSLHIERNAALFDLVLDFWDADDGLHGVLEYNCDLFERSSVERLVHHLQTLLTAFADDAETQVDSAPLLDEGEIRQLLAFSNGPTAEYPINQSLAEAFEKQAAMTPHRRAAVAHGEALDYANLNERANRVAHLLNELGVRTNEPVGVMVPRGLDYLAAVLGVVKAGGAFMPLDTAYPAERLRYMLDDSGCSVLLATVEDIGALMSGGLPPQLRDVVLLSDEGAEQASWPSSLRLHDEAEFARQPVVNPTVANSPRDLLYMLYTSGSTGLPKGTLVRHDGALNHIFAEFRLLEFHAGTAFLQSAPASSDISVWQCLAPLLIGGRIVFADFETMCSPAALFELIRDEQVTLIELVPVVLEGLLNHAAGLLEAERSLPHLEWAMVTGEAVSVALVNRWLRIWPRIPLVNAYGPTEAADDVCQHVIRSPLPETQTTVPIGVPVDNLSVMVLDDRGQMVPIGVPGEICISGVGVGEGYWRQPERTRSAFVPNPYRDVTFGERLYRTGDLGRWRVDGSLEFLGRLDHQVKIRGFRVELGEIEAALRQHHQVREALVLDRQDTEGERQLVAYLQVQMDAEGSDELVQQQVKLWKELHEDSYSDTHVLAADPTFNTIGWDSTYTGEPLSAAEMQECINNAVTRILELRPHRMLEIGCGTGLLLYRLVSHCERYYGTDLSAVAIEQLESARKQLSIPGLERAELREQRADDFRGFEVGGFDTIALNSVIQYFPSVDYLLDVLRGAVRHSAPGGSIFIGDVRSLPLLRAYHTSVQSFKAEETLTREELSQRIEAQLAREQELAVSPEFFHALSHHLPRISRAKLRPKRGRHENEMTRFRFDVVLQIDEATPSAPCPADAWQDWRLDCKDLDAIRAHLQTARPDYWGLRNVANARLSDEQSIARWMRESPRTATVRELREWLKHQLTMALDPESLWQLSETLPYRVEIVVEPESTSGEFAVLFSHYESPTVEIDLDSNTAVRPWAEYANSPLQEKFARQVMPQLREFIKTSLPSHMIPAAFVVLDRFPLTPNGKIDREALPKPVFEATRGSDYVAPRTDTERLIESVWIAVLGVDEPSVNDNFFSLGGHSLKATQVVSRLQQQGKSLSLRDIFNSPTIAELAAVLDRQQDVSAPELIPATPEAPDYPVSHAQQRLWVLSQMDGSAAYHMVDGLRLRGPLQASALGHAFAALVERHETLRTSFVEVEGQLRQRVAETVEHELGFEDLSGHSDPLAAARALALEHAGIGFDLSRAPLLRVRLLKLAEAEHVLLFNMHHIISDGWSMDILIREFMLLYDAAVAGRPASLPPLRIQYRDYVAWQHERLRARAEDERAYWLRQLQELPPPLELPTDFPRPPLKTYNGGRRRLKLSNESSQSLNALAQREQSSLFMLLTALVKVLLHRYSGQTDISLGCPVAGRHHTDLENQIGFFINTLVLRDRLDGSQSFTDFLRQVRETATAAYEFQDYPFDQLVQDLNPPRDPSRNPLFDVMLALQNTANVALSLPELEITSLGLDYGVTQFDLLWNFTETADGLYLELQYNSDLFRPETIERMLDSWHTLTTGAVAEPETPLGRLPLLKPSERAALLRVSPPPSELTPAYTSLVDWFETQAQARPHAIAISDEGREFSYAELNTRANLVARRVRHQLDESGAAGNVLVGLCMQRSAELVIGMLGILKAGAAYVPLDPDVPAARLRFILQDARVPLLVTQAGVLDLPAEELPPLCLLGVDERVDANDEPNLEHALTPSAPAYVIYTSGSTGEPKGALITHGNVLRLFSMTQGWFDFGPGDVWTLFHSYAFDFSVWEIWGALLYGGRLVIVPYMVSRSPEQFYELLSREAVTVLNQTPSAFRQLMQAEAARHQPLPLALRFVIFGGEALEPSQLRPWFEAHGDRRPQLINMYGITETTVHVTYRPLTGWDAEQSSSLIGEPLPDLYLYVLDEWLEPVPTGVAGELYVGGAGLAQGYLFREELTAQRFIADPFRPGQRLYRTGDRVRRRSDAELEYLGRLDSQVKIRGFRIEVGEVESVLSRYPGVRESAVTMYRQNGDACLVAYYVASNGDVAATDLRRYLQQHLPAYMVPLHFVAVDGRLPLTVNGKLDHRALPQPGEVTTESGNGHSRSPRTELEKEILQVWRKALGHDLLGPDDNLFEHGAHSVIVVQVRNQLQNSLQRDIPVVMLFQYPTVAALAAQLEGGSQSPNVSDETETNSRASQRRDAVRRRTLRRPVDSKPEP